MIGLVHVTQLALPLLRGCEGGGARIVQVGSVGGKIGLASKSIYAGSKFAVEGISDSLRLELYDQNIAVVVLEPAYVRTNIAEKQTGANAPWRLLSPEKEALLEANYGGVALADAKEARFLITKWATAVGPPVSGCVLRRADFSSFRSLFRHSFRSSQQ